MECPTFTKEFEGVMENAVGLPLDLNRRLGTFHMSFYLQNRNKMTIKQSGDEIFFFVSDNKLKKDIYQKVYGIKPESDREFVFDENSLGRYLEMIEFEPPINTFPFQRYITSEEINKDMKRLFG